MKQKPSTPSRETAGHETADNTEQSRFSVELARVEELADARSRHILKAFVAFRDGDFSARLPADWPGIEGRIAETFNQTIAREESITREVKRLSVTVGKEGRLKQRMSLPGAVGDWAVKADSINTLLDDLVRPTVDVARTIGAVAKGDLSQSMELEVDGRALKGSSSARRSWSTP